jgi:mono/diheme cytochrome c family protein
MKRSTAQAVACALRVGIVAMVLAVTVHAQAPQPSAKPGPAGNADAGKKLFVGVGCYQCHGYEAQGSSSTGPRLGPRPIAFAAFSRYVRQPTGQMPPYTSKVVSDADLASIYAFIQSRPEPAKDIPLLRR